MVKNITKLFVSLGDIIIIGSLALLLSKALNNTQLIERKSNDIKVGARLGIEAGKKSD